MSDIELLERAARAAGIDLAHSYYIPTPGAIMTAAGAGMKPWNPLIDDGDALRLAVRLGIAFSCRGGNAQATYKLSGAVGDFYSPVDEPAHVDPDAATRRAIVRAAAAMADTP